MQYYEEEATHGLVGREANNLCSSLAGPVCPYVSPYVHMPVSNLRNDSFVLPEVVDATCNESSVTSHSSSERSDSPTSDKPKSASVIHVSNSGLEYTHPNHSFRHLFHGCSRKWHRPFTQWHISKLALVEGYL